MTGFNQIGDGDRLGQKRYETMRMSILAFDKVFDEKLG
jgi:hypothetical protein